MKLDDIGTAELEAELVRRRERARLDTLEQRGRQAAAIDELLTTHPTAFPRNNRLLDALKNPELYEFSISATYTPLKEITQA